MRTLAVVILLASSVACADPQAAPGRVVAERLPGGGIEPQAVTDASGAVHVVYFKGEPAAGDVYYVRRSADGKYSTPTRVNSQPGSAVAVGSVRGPQVALGRNGRVHVIWNGSDAARPRPKTALPLLYARSTSTGAAFEPQRNLITRDQGTDGGGAVAADRDGHVFVVWHANSERPGEDHRMVYMARSNDDGAAFSPEVSVSPERLGACGCCSMRAFVDHAGTLLLLYRAATDLVHRDMTLLQSRDHGATTSATTLDRWQLNACPMSSSSLAEGPRGVTAAWETQGQIRFADLSGFDGAASVRSAPDSGRRKHPVLAYNRAGELLLAWAEDTAWQKGGSIAWQIYDVTGHPTSDRGTVSGLPVWGLAATAPLPDGRFVLLY